MAPGGILAALLYLRGTPHPSGEFSQFPRLWRGTNPKSGQSFQALWPKPANLSRVPPYFGSTAKPLCAHQAQSKAGKKRHFLRRNTFDRPLIAAKRSNWLKITVALFSPNRFLFVSTQIGWYNKQTSTDQDQAPKFSPSKPKHARYRVVSVYRYPLPPNELRERFRRPR